ncbi:hypothetical protein B0H11DRAFT_2048764 [Mycena galericulata]|nr:hypothetical protein B0H11DRAFT_2048764 [Mycena galericulata]
MDPLPLIHTNGAPTEFQAREIHRLLEAGQDDLARIEESILKVSLILSELQFQKRQRTKSLTALRRILSPIRRLPNELLTEIFLFCRANSTRSTVSILDVREAPMLLSHVAAHWRTVSIGTPMLWDTPCFRESIVSHPKAIYMRSILQRSRHLPTSLAFETFGDSGPRAIAGNTDCFQFFTDLGDRVQHISLDLPWRDVMEHIKNPPGCPLFPILASLKVTLEDDGLEDWPAILDSFRRAPGLRSLTLNASSSPFTPTFPWVQLTSLTMFIPIDETTVYLVLRQCLQLKTCVLFEMSYTGDTQDSQPLCTLDALRSFSFSPWEADSGKLLEFFSFPKLESLSLSHCVNMPATVLLDLRARSHFKLQDLTLCNLPLTTEELLEVLRHLLTLQTLVLGNSATYIVDDLLRAFTYSQSHVQSLLLPRLTTLTIRHESMFLTGSVVADMVESLARHAGDEGAPFPSIHSVKFYLDGPKFTPAVESRLAGACLSGFLEDFRAYSRQ